MMTYANILRQAYPTMSDHTLQTVSLPGMIPNNAGGHYYEVDDWVKLDRFLILGSDAGTYYVTPQDLTKANVEAVKRCIEADGLRVVSRIVEISVSGRAPKNDSALLALALACSAKDDATRKEALAAISQVARTGTHLLMFVDFVKRFRGMGRGLRKALGRWFTDMPAEKLALQAIKYNQRNGWALRDVLRLAHPKPKDKRTDFKDDPINHKDCILKWIVNPNEKGTGWQDVVSAKMSISEIYEKFDSKEKMIGSSSFFIKEWKVPREALPTELLNHKEIWQALLQDMPMTAMIRNLGKMTSVGLCDMFSNDVDLICDRLGDSEKLSRARIHPMQILLASRAYKQGHGDKGNLKWKPNQKIVGALNQAFDLTFPQVRSTAKRIVVAVDCSGSMTARGCSGSSEMTPWQAGSAMALILSRVERNAHFCMFDTDIYNLDIIGKRLDDVLNLRCNGGGTDLSLPIMCALQNKVELDAFVIFTDNETWAGRRHAVQTLHEYRRRINPKVKLVVAALSANSGSIIDPNDPLSFGICGLDASVPQLISDFI